MLEKIEGVYSATKTGTMINLTKAGGDRDIQVIDYFAFQSCLFRFFSVDKINKILNYLNEKKQVIIDFDNEKAMLVKDKDPNFLSLFAKEMSPETVANFYMENDEGMDDNNYIKPNLGDDKYVESIYRRQTDS